MEEARIEEVAAIAARHAGSSPAAVLPARTTAGEERYACAFARGDGFSWLVVDGAGGPLTAPVEVRAVAETIAMCETAEEGAALLAAAEADAQLAAADELGAEGAAAVAIRAMREALAPLLAEPSGGVRVAEGAYLDRVAAAAALVGDRFDLLKEAAYAASAGLRGEPGEAGEPLAEALWTAVRTLARDGAPDRFRETVEGGMGAARAFADDVLDNYLIDLEDEG